MSMPILRGKARLLVGLSCSSLLALALFLVLHRLLNVSSASILRPSRMVFFAAIALSFFLCVDLLNVLLLLYLPALPLLLRQKRFVRFHAAQSLLFFGTMSILGWVCSLFPFALFGLGGIVGLVGFIGWIVLMVAAHRGRYYKLPLFGDYAEQLANRFAL